MIQNYSTPSKDRKIVSEEALHSRTERKEAERSSRKRMSGNSEVDQLHRNNSSNKHIGAGSGSGEDKQNGRKHSRYTQSQVEEMEERFKEFPHPDDKLREELSLKLGLTPLQIKFWFQNRRTQLKIQQERADNSNLRRENQILRLDNMALLQTMNNFKCATCGGPNFLGEMLYKQQRLDMENTQLKEEMGKLSAFAANSIGRPTQAKAEESWLTPSRNDGVGSSRKRAILPSSDMPGCSPLISSGGAFLDLDKSLALEAAMNAMEELIGMAQIDEPLWVKITSASGITEVLNVDQYCRLFPRGMGIKHIRASNMKRNGSRDSSVVSMKGAALVDVFMDVNKWMEMFPSIVTRARTIQVLSQGDAGIIKGSLQLMYAELQVLSPLVSTRQIYFLRYSHQHINGVWVVVDFSPESLKGNASASDGLYRKHPSGCIIQEMPNGYSKVTWVEHGEAERMFHKMYAQLINSGAAFPAQRWLSTLQRQSERFKALMDLGDSGVSTIHHRNMMKLAQNMSNKFYANIGALSAIPQSDNDGIKITSRKSSEVGQSSSVVICAGTSVRLPVCPQKLFDFLRDEQTRSRSNVLSCGLWEKVANIASGSDPANCISLFNASNKGDTEVMLQESCRDSSGYVVVCAAIDVEALNSEAQSSTHIPPPSGFAILPDHASAVASTSLVRTSILHEGASGSSSGMQGLYGGSSGSLLTIAFQVTETNVPTCKLSIEYVAKIHDIMNGNVQRIKSVFGCADN